MRSYTLGAQTVGRVGYGSMPLPGAGCSAADDDAAVAVVQAAVGAGVTHIDTAPFYGHGHVMELLRRALSPYSDELILVSKVGARARERRFVAAQRPEELRAGVEDTLRLLAVEQVPVVNLRRMEGAAVDPEQDVPLDDQLAEMVALRDEGKIGAIGLSNVSAATVEAALPAGIVCVQNAYSLLSRGDEPVLELCGRLGLPYVPYFPLGSAFPGFPKVAEDPTVRCIAAELDLTPAQVGLAWLLEHAPHILLIAGTTSVEHLRQNVAADAIRFTPEQIDALDAIAPPAG